MVVEIDDHTVRRYKQFAASWGCDGFYAGNLAAYVETIPAKLPKGIDLIGPENDEHLREMAFACGITVACWGDHPLAGTRAKEVLQNIHLSVECLGKTQGGFPRHVSRLPNAAKLQNFWSPWE